MSETKVYLAGPYSSRDTLAEYAAELRKIGYVVRARWLDGTHEVATNPTVEAEAEPAERSRWAREDIEDVQQCDMLIAFTAKAAGVPGAGTSGGRHVETGYALGQGKAVILIGEPENVFHWLSTITRVANWHEAVIELSYRMVMYLRDIPLAAAVSS